MPLPVRRPARPPRPPLPEGDAPRLPREVYRDVRAATPPGALGDVSKAFAAAGEALAAGDLERALALLTWAKSVASRSVVIREALGVAHYLAGDYGPAHSELLTYRRLSDRHDQNHVLADCARALERPDKAVEYVEEMLADPAVPGDRKVEGMIVLAGARADRGDLRGALTLLEQAAVDSTGVEPWHARLWYAAGDLAERIGDRDRARELFEAVVAVDQDFLDAEERLQALE